MGGKGWEEGGKCDVSTMNANLIVASPDSNRISCEKRTTKNTFLHTKNTKQMTRETEYVFIR